MLSGLVEGGSSSTAYGLPYEHSGGKVSIHVLLRILQIKGKDLRSSRKMAEQLLKLLKQGSSLDDLKALKEKWLSKD